jgi:hypothetical protein
MPMSTKCQKNEKKMTINVIQHDNRLLYLQLFYNGGLSIASKMTFTTKIYCSGLYPKNNYFSIFSTGRKN